MSEKLMNSVVSALVGGAVGAAVVFFMAGKTTYDSLEVGQLTITKQATLLNAEGKDDVVIKEGSVLANNVILGKKFIGTQYQGHVFVGNRMFTSPDDLIATPMEQWRFYTELGSSNELGGEMIVRSPKGANVVNKPIEGGLFFRAGFDQNDGPQIFARVNGTDGMTLPVALLRPAPQQQTGEAGTAPGQQPQPGAPQEQPLHAEAPVNRG